MSRRPTLGHPPDDLKGFPMSVVPPRLVRVCRATCETWWFSSDGSGRFDLAPPAGTCYLATDDFASIREASRAGPVSTRWVGDRELRRVTPPNADARLAATTRQAAAHFGVTTELATVVPYDLPRRWARAFHRHGLDGIRYELRHDPRAKPSGVALFGATGARGRPNGATRPLTVGDVERSGVRVLPVPGSDGLTIVD